MTPAPVNTKKAARRSLSFHCTKCVREELARLQAAHAAGTLSHTGNWTEGEILEHVAKMWMMAFDGFPESARPPLIIKLIARLMKGKFTSGKTLPPGFKLPKQARFMLPAPGTSFEVGMQKMIRVLDRIDAGERMTIPSPAFGRLTHDEWMRLHLSHAQLHFGFLFIGRASGSSLI